jgi:hypothetical protein
VSTHLIAANHKPTPEVYTIDPNLPLHVEMLSMKSDMGGVDMEQKTQEISRAVSTVMGMEDHIHYFEGGFSSVETFSSHRSHSRPDIKLVGPEVCKQNGPFDLVFLDGLHYTSSVLSDIRLASQYLAPGGIILLHDCVGMWGSNVRRAVFEFLSEEPDFTFQHERFSDLYRSIGVLYRRTEHKKLTSRFRQPGTPSKLPASFLGTLMASFANMHSPNSLIEVHFGADRIAAHFEEASDVSVHSFNLSGKEKTGKGFGTQIAKLDKRQDAAIVIGAADFLDDAALSNLLGRLSKMTDCVMLMATPPGEVGSAGVYSRPLISLVAVANAAGYDVFDAIMPSLEPTQFAFSPSPLEFVATTTYMNTVIAIPRGAPIPKDVALIPLVGDAISRIEDLALQRLALGNGMRWLLKENQTMQGDIAEYLRILNNDPSELDEVRRKLAEIGPPRIKLFDYELYLGRRPK